MSRVKAGLIALVALVALVVAGATIAGATIADPSGVPPSADAEVDDDAGEADDDADEADEQVTGAVAQRAGAAALAEVGDGSVTEVEAADEGAAGYEVEVRRADGTFVEVALDGDLTVVSVEHDDD
jgi:uncharacterized membrane protein YkoI